jgi:hypothetical protein
MLYLLNQRDPPPLIRSRPQRRTRVRVSSRVRVDVKHNPRHIPLIQARPCNPTRRSNRATSSNFQIQTLRVQLRTVIVLTAMQGNDLMANDVVSRRELRRQNSRRLEVILNKLVRDPSPRADNGRLRYLGPFEGAGGEGCAVTYIPAISMWSS